MKQTWAEGLFEKCCNVRAYDNYWQGNNDRLHTAKEKLSFTLSNDVHAIGIDALSSECETFGNCIKERMMELYQTQTQLTGTIRIDGRDIIFYIFYSDPKN